MTRKHPLWFLFIGTLLLCSCTSAKRTVKISLYEDRYVTGSFVRSTAPDEVRVYTDNAPLPLTTEVIGDFWVADPIASRKASLDILLDTVKKEISYLGGNGLFLIEHTKPVRGVTDYHTLNGYILLQPDTILKPNREHSLNKAFREHLEKEEAERQRIRGIYTPHNFHFSAGYSSISYKEDAVISDAERQLTKGLGVQGIYEYAFNRFPTFSMGLFYHGYFAESPLRYEGISYQGAMTNHLAGVLWSSRSATKRGMLKGSWGLGRQWEAIDLRPTSSEATAQKLTTDRPIIYYSIEYEYRLHQHWGIVAKAYGLSWFIPNPDGYSDRSTLKTSQLGISLGVNFHL